MKKLHVSDNPVELHLIKLALEENGIEVRLENENLAPLLGEIPQNPSTLPTIYVVDEKDIEDAEQILSKFRQSKATRVLSPAGVSCPLCNSKEVGAYSKYAFFFVSLVFMLPLVFLSILAYVKSRELIIIVIGSVVGILVLVVLLCLYQEINSDKKRYSCDDCGMQWTVRKESSDRAK